MKTGLLPARHIEIGARLAALRDELQTLGVEVANAFPKRTRESRCLLRALDALDQARSRLSICDSAWNGVGNEWWS